MGRGTDGGCHGRGQRRLPQDGGREGGRGSDPHPPPSVADSGEHTGNLLVSFITVTEGANIEKVARDARTVAAGVAFFIIRMSPRAFPIGEMLAAPFLNRYGVPHEQECKYRWVVVGHDQVGGPEKWHTYILSLIHISEPTRPY